MRPALANDRIGLLSWSLLIELTFCCKSSMNISIGNRYCNRFIHFARLIFPANHNDAFVYNPDHIWDRACACYHSRGTGHPICDLSVGASWLASLKLLLFRQRIASPIMYLLPVSSACWYKLYCNRINDHERLFFSQHRPPVIRHFFLLAVVIAGDCTMTWAFHVLRKICRIKIS